MTLVSVIIPTFNRSALLKQAIESVLAAEHDDSELEILVIDDGSTDDTSEVVKNYPVIYLPQRGGLGASGARNIGLEAARGDYIAFLDDDDVWLPIKLTTQLRLLRDHREYGMVVAQMWCANSDLAARWGPFPQEPRLTQLSMADLLRLDPQLGATMVRREVAQKIRFDNALPRMQDLDWFLKVAQCAPVGYSNVPVMVFRTRQRSSNELWMFYSGMVKVFHRSTGALPFASRLKMQPILWKWQGWYTWAYLKEAQRHARQRNYRQAVRAIGYTLRISPLQVPVLVGRAFWEKLARLHAAPAPQG